MRKQGWTLGLAVLVGLSVLLTASLVAAQWGVIQQGVDAAKGGKQAQEKPATKEDPNAPMVKSTDPDKPAFSVPMTFKNTARGFSFTIPAGWQQNAGNINDKRGADYGKPGTTMNFTFRYEQMPPSFPAKSAVEEGYKRAKEDMTIGKIIATKRRDQSGAGVGKKGIIGWEMTQTRDGGSGSHQSIIWTCYDGQNFNYSFHATAHPDHFNAVRSELQRIIDSVRFD